MMCYIFIVISIVVVVSGQEESKYTTFRDRDVNTLFEQLHKVSLENKEIVNLNSRILKENENLKHLIENLSNENVDLERRVNVIEKNIPFRNNEGKTNGFDINIKENLYENLTERYDQGHRLNANKNDPMLMSMNLKDKNKTKDKRHIQRETSGEVAFFAKVLDTLQNLGDHQDIPFKTVDVDTHNAFHGDTGIFTTPVAGYYAVFATILTFPGVKLEFQIVHNGNWLCSGYSKGVSGEPYVFGSGSTSAIVYSNVGDKIWTKVNSDAHTGTGDMVFHEYSSFMGFRL